VHCHGTTDLEPDAVLFPPAALSMAVYQMLIINRCYFLPY
jgi:hypothetical protein